MYSEFNAEVQVQQYHTEFSDDNSETKLPTKQTMIVPNKNAKKVVNQ